MRPKLLVIGVDAASGPLLREWADQGALPNIAQLMGRGRTATMKGLTGFFTGSSWPSLSTGTVPARHGVHYLAQLAPGSYKFSKPHEAKYIQTPVFWKILSDAGKRVAVLDAPLSKLDSTINGTQTVEWSGHDPIFGFQAHPAQLRQEVLEKFGVHPAPPYCDDIGRTSEDFRKFAEALVEGVRAKTRMTMHVLESEPWDLFFTVFDESHCVGHQCWHLHDPSHPSHDAAHAANHGDPVLQVYRAIDESIGQILAAAGNPPVIVFASHGMSHSVGVTSLLPEILARLGVTIPLPPEPKRTAPLDVVRPLLRFLPRSVKNLGQRLLHRPQTPGGFALPVLGVDTQRSRCFVVPNGLLTSGIRLNLVGREPHGIISPGDEEDRFFAELAADLLDLSDPVTGRQLVRQVIRTKDIYRGPQLDALPDILVEWHDDTPVGSAAIASSLNCVVRAASAKIGAIDSVYDYGRTGEHRPDGLLIVAGENVDPNTDGGTVSLLDLAPTITAALGVPMSSADGQSVPGMIPTIN
jgi:predicted AlkP superfamily phosphohydrolase/phosphomutase